MKYIWRKRGRERKTANADAKRMRWLALRSPRFMVVKDRKFRNRVQYNYIHSHTRSRLLVFEGMSMSMLREKADGPLVSLLCERRLAKIKYWLFKNSCCKWSVLVDVSNYRIFSIPARLSLKIYTCEWIIVEIMKSDRVSMIFF